MTTPADLLAYAESKVGADQVGIRAGIGRAYYAAFHAVQDAVWPMASNGDIGENGCIHHGRVVIFLRNWSTLHPDQRMRMAHGAEATKLAHRLRLLKDDRERADYVLGDPATTTRLTDSISRARLLVRFGEKLAGASGVRSA